MLVQCSRLVPARCLQYLAAFSAAITFLIAGTFSTWPSPSAPKVDSLLETGISSGEWAWVIALLGVGGGVAPFLASYIMNKLGRKPTLLICMPFFITSWLLIIFARTPIYLQISRVFAGLGIGFAFSVCPVYVSEIAEDDIRGVLGTLMQLLLNVGSLFEFGVGPYVSPQLLGWLSAIFPILFFVLMLFMPESPYFFCMKNQTDKAQESLKRLRGGKSHQEIQDELNKMQKVVEEEMTTKGRPQDLIATAGTRRAVVLMVGLIIIQQCTGVQAILSNAEEIFKASGGTALDPSVSAIIIGAVQLLTSFVTSLLVDRIGRRILFLISTAGCSVSLAILGTYQFLALETDLDTSSFTWVPLICLMGFLVTYCLGVGPLGIAYCSEIFPSNVRGLAVSIFSSCISLTFIIVTKLYQVVADSAGVYVTFWFFSAMSLLGCLFVYFLLLETKGKSLEDIVAELNGEKKEEPTDTVYSIKI